MPRRTRKTHGAKRQRDDGGGWVDYSDPSMLRNETWERFYRGTIVPEGEWEAFIGAMRTPLPVALRINQSRQGADILRDKLLKEFSTLNLHAVAAVPSALSGPTSRSSLKRDDANRLAKVVIHALNESGRLSRQEVVSMIPPLFLDVQPGQRVVDMCAAPGSKTSQILEALIAPRGRGSAADDIGCVIANDINAGRLDILSKQTARTSSAQSAAIVTGYDAMRFPLCAIGAPRFDRVLCDVMCSGDGTLRKSVDLWPRWNTIMGPSLHCQQCNVLLRGMQLCAAGGIVVYSTCSLHPGEDEAVVSYCLSKANGRFELVDISQEHPNLLHYRGLSQWQLANRDGTARFDTQPQASAAAAAAGDRFKFMASMFPPPAASEQHLERCVRVPPHLQDTGGFFIAKLRCIQPLDYDARAVTNVPPPHTPNWTPVGSAVREHIQRLLELPEAFPYHRLFQRSELGREAKFYLATASAASTLSVHLANAAVGVGTKIFESPAKHSLALLRFTAEGAEAAAAILPSHVRSASAAALLDAFDAQNVSDGSSAAASTKGVTLPRAAADAVWSEGVEPPTLKHFIVAVSLAPEIGQIFFPADLDEGAVRMRISVPLMNLLRFSLGRLTVPPRSAAGRDAAGGDASESDASQAGDESDDGGDNGEPS